MDSCPWFCLQHVPMLRKYSSHYYMPCVICIIFCSRTSDFKENHYKHIKLHAPTTSHWQTCWTTICFRQSAGWHRAELYTAAIEASWSLLTKGGPYATSCPAPPGIGVMQIVGVLCCPGGQMVLQGKLLISSGRWVGAFFLCCDWSYHDKSWLVRSSLWRCLSRNWRSREPAEWVWRLALDFFL